MGITANGGKGHPAQYGWWHDIAQRLSACGRYFFSIYEY